MTKLITIFGSTPIDLDEIEGLIPNHISTQSELNEWEQNNIIDASLWLNKKKLTSEDILNQIFLKQLHLRMFNKTWFWAGEFRKTNKNIGIDWHTIPTYLKQLFNDTSFQLLNQSFEIDEIAARFHHRLVFIHPFVNGNGRISRLITDSFLLANKQKSFTWGMTEFKELDQLRKEYITALQKADKHDYSLLLQFVRK